MGDGKSGSSSKTYNGYATFAGAVCLGPVAEIVAIIIDGKQRWPATEGATVGMPPGADYSTITVPDHGTCRFYWGKPDQAACEWLTNTTITGGDVHPAYKGIAYIAFRDFLCGQERASLPNIQVVARRVPAQSAVTGDPAELTDDQANGIAVLADLLMAPRYGLGLSGSDIGGAQAAADALEVETDTTAISVLVDKVSTIRQVAQTISEHTDAWLRWNHSSGKIEMGVWSHGSAPISFTTLTQDHLAEPPQITCDGWPASKTGADVTFTDRQRNYKDDSEPVKDQRALAIIGEDRPARIERKWITRRSQAKKNGLAYHRQRNLPRIEAELSVRRAFGSGIRPGDWIRLDMDPEPGGSQLLQYCRVISRTVPRRGPVRIQAEADNTLYPVLYVPPSDPPMFTQPEVVDGLDAYRLVELPPSLADGAFPAVAALAVRPSLRYKGLRVLFDPVGDSTFVDLGIQGFFAVKVGLSADLAPNAESDAWELTIAGTPGTSALRLSVEDQVDADWFFGLTSTGDEFAADDTLLLILVEPDGEYIAEAGGIAQMEICSVKDWEIYGAGTWPKTYAINALRARRGTAKTGFTSAAAEGWLIRRASLAAFYHADFGTIRHNREVGDTPDEGTFRLQPFTDKAIRGASDCTDIPFRWPTESLNRPRLTWEAPGVTSWPVSGSGGSVRIRGRWDDSDADLVSISLSWRVAGEQAESVLVSQSVTGGSVVFDVSPTFSVEGTYDILARAVDATGLRSEERVQVIVTAENKVANPQAVPAGGHFTTFPKSVTINCSTPGATIKYSISILWDPSGSWSTYSGPVSVGRDKTLYAYAEKAGMTTSDTMSWDFEYWPGGVPP